MVYRTRLLMLLLALGFTMRAVAQDTNGDGVVTMLLPIAFSAGQQVNGANGSVWKTEIWAHNQSAEGVLPQPTGVCLPQCFPLPAGFLGQISSVTSNQSAALFRIPADAAPDFHVSARLLEIARRAQPTGVDLPVVREADFLTRSSSFLSIPVGLSIRSALRVYDPRLRQDARVSVEFYDENNTLLGTTTLAPSTDPVLAREEARKGLVPSVASILDLTSAFPQLQASGRFHVVVRPEVDGMEYWAFVSVTDNESQHVLLITSN